MTESTGIRCPPERGTRPRPIDQRPFDTLHEAGKPTRRFDIMYVANTDLLLSHFHSGFGPWPEQLLNDGRSQPSAPLRHPILAAALPKALSPSPAVNASHLAEGGKQKKPLVSNHLLANFWLPTLERLSQAAESPSESHQKAPKRRFGIRYHQMNGPKGSETGRKSHAVGGKIQGPLRTVSTARTVCGS